MKKSKGIPVDRLFKKVRLENAKEAVIEAAKKWQNQTFIYEKNHENFSAMCAAIRKLIKLEGE